jgi:hypothetical protein
VAIGQQAASVKCPVCQNPMSVPVDSIIDVERQPELKMRLLEGQLNMFPCPACGNVLGLSTPILYHDGSKELLLCLTPAAANVQGGDTQKVIGNLTNTLMNSLPPEKRKAYLFQPRTFLTLESMIETILGADGITKEMIETQQAKLNLIEPLLEAIKDDSKLKSIIAENENLIDREFFAMLGSLITAAKSETQKKEVQDLIILHRRLMPLTEAGRELLAAEKKYEEEILATKDELLLRLVETQDEAELEGLVRTGRPYMDYAFFQELTGNIESAGPEDAKKLTERREQILTISERQDEEAKQLLTERAEFLKRLLQAGGDPDALLREETHLLDEPFFAILSANIQQATEAGQKEAVEALQRIGARAMEIVRENAPPAIQLINRLMEAQSSEEIDRILEENTEQLDPEFFEMVEILTAELASAGQGAAADQIKDIAERAKLLQ